MVEMTLLEEKKQTENKVRWDSTVDGAPFELYIPKWRVPLPWPRRIGVEVMPYTARPLTGLSPSDAAERPKALKQALTVHLRKVSEHTKTIRYQPEGQQLNWEIGEPYIPATLTYNQAERLTIVVRWNV